MNCIEIKNLNFQYPSRNHQQTPMVFQNLNLSIEAGKSVGIIGANGVGKSTLLKLLVGLLPVDDGEIIVEDIHLEEKHLPKIREKLGYVFQDSDAQLLMSTVKEDVAFGPRNYGYDEDEVNRRVKDALQRTHIEELGDRQIYRLSGGQKKLTSIATILSMGADILLMDEPSVALDPKNRENLIHLIRGLTGTKVIASHDLDFIYDTCSQVALLGEGNVVAWGEGKEILKNRKLLEENGLMLPLSFRFMDEQQLREV